MRYAIVGAGAVGSTIGYLLAKAGKEVSLVDPAATHIKAIQERGLRVSLGYYGSDERKEITISLRAALNASEIPAPVDVVILLVKGTATRAAMAQNVVPLCGPHTLVLTMQNGWGHAATIAEFVRPTQIAYGTTMIASKLQAPGYVCPNFTHGIDNHLGAPSPELQPVLEQVCEDLSKGGSKSVYENRVESLIWSKLARNCGGNGLLAILRVNGRVAKSFPEYNRLQQALLLEVEAVAKAQGIECDPDIIHQSLQTYPINGSPIPEHLPSTAQDVKNQCKTEIDFLNGAVAREGKALGIPTPYNDMVCSLIHIIENSYEHQF